MYFFYILKKYLKNFFLILFSLSILFIIIDLLINYKRLPNSSNLQVLYIYYDFLYSIDLFYSLALIFSFLLTGYYMVKFNEFVSFYSLGFDIKKLLKPFVFFSFIIYVLFLLFDSSKLAYVKEKATSILNNNKYINTDLFLKYNNKIVYIKKIIPFTNEAENIKVFVLKNSKITKIISAKKAKFQDNIWFSKDANITFITSKSYKTVKSDIFFLKNFKPKIISNLKELKSISLYDAYIAFKYFKNINVNVLLSMVFFKIFTPLSIIGLIIIFMFYFPIHSRISNITLFLIKSIFLSIIVWGMELLLYKFSKQGVILPYFIMLPTILIFIYGLYLIIKEK